VTATEYSHYAITAYIAGSHVINIWVVYVLMMQTVKEEDEEATCKECI